MPSVFATLKVKADQVEEAKKALAQMVQHVRRNEPGNLAYIFHQRKDDPTVFMAYEKYASDEALAQHRRNMSSGPVNLGGLLDGAPQIVMVEEI
jgi:quinol monooxygenase YgiN